jgi:two-component system sensor histidine kinase YesM
VEIKKAVLNGASILNSAIKNMTIRSKLIVFYLMFLIIPLLLLNYISYKYSTNLLKLQATDSLANLSEQLNTVIEDRLLDIDQISSMIYSPSLFEIVSKKIYTPDTFDIVEDNKKMNVFFSYLLYQSKGLSSIYIFTVSHNSFYKSNIDQMQALYNPEGDEWYPKVLESNGKSVIFGVHRPWPIVKTVTDKYVFSIAKIIKDIRGKNVCTILLDVNLDSISEMIRKFKLNFNSNILVLDDSNNVIYDDGIYQTGEPLDNPIILDVIKKRQNKINVHIAGVDSFLTYKTSNISGWKVVSITPLTVINRNIVLQKKINIFITLVSSILSSLLLIMLYLVIYRPIHQLRISMKLVEKGDFSVRLKAITSDEIGGLSSSFNRMIDRINNLIESEYKANIIKKEAEFKALQAQINPHFLYNTMQLISSMAVVYNVKEIDRISRSLSSMFRYTIEYPDVVVALSKEIKHITDYLYIQKNRLNDKFEVIYDIQEEVREYVIIKLTLQPFIENIFKHGFENKKEKGIIIISIKLRRNRLIIKISDNGSGIEQEKLNSIKKSIYGKEGDILNTSTSNIGMNNVNIRFKHYFGESYRFFIKSTLGNGTKILIILPAVK